MFTRFNDIDRLFGTMNLLSRRLDNFYSELGRPSVAGYTREESFFRANLHQKGDQFEMRMEVPGMDKESLDIKIQGNYLEISGTRNRQIPDGYRVHKTERRTGTFSRSFTLPDDVDGNRVEAVLKDGILTLTLPKSEEAKPRKITIN